MESTTDTLLIGALLTVSLGFLIPRGSFGAALSYHLLRSPEDASGYVAYFARISDPDEPRGLARLLSGRRNVEQPHSIHRLAFFEDISLVLLSNFMPIAVNVAHDPYYTAGPLLRLFTLAFFIGEALWFWWFLRFVSQHRALA